MRLKKAAQPMPNHLLRRARQERGWSQQDVADRIEASQVFLVNRWECGRALPSPHYRQKLCDLFGMNVHELGLLQEEATPMPFDPTSPIYDSAIPLPFAEASYLVGRTDLLAQLQQLLCTDESMPQVALSGIPGVGKTALATALANDPTIQKHFRDGILWVGLGLKPHVVGLLSRWGKLLGISEIEMEKLQTHDDWTGALHALMRRRQMLLVIDDAWTIEEALAFKLGGMACAHVVTTRLPDVATRFAGERAIQVQELNLEDGIQLLARLAPTVVKAEPEEARALVQTVGGLPLALTLMGNHLSVEARYQQRRRIRAALGRLQQAEERLKIEQPQAGLNRQVSLPITTPLSLQTAIGVSVHSLDEVSHSALQALSIFPPKPNTFSEEAAVAVAACSEQVLDTLLDAGLMECGGPDRYTLHQTIADYAHTHLEDASAHRRMVEYMISFAQAYEADYETLEPESVNVQAALRIAWEQGWWVEMVRGVSAFVRFLQARGRYAEAEEQLQLAYQAANTLEDRPGIATALLFQGEIAEKRGNYAQAETLLQEGLALVRRMGDCQRISAFLSNLGVTALDQGEYARAEAYSQEGLIFARQSDDHDRISLLLLLLGLVARKRGDYDHAKMYLQEGLELARHIGHRERISRLLMSLGAMANEQLEYTRAEIYLQEGLELARQIGHYERIMKTLSTLGTTMATQGRYSQAEMYLQEGLALAKKVGHYEHIGEMLLNLGVMASERGNHTQAEVYFYEGLELARQSNHLERIGLYLMSLGDLADILGDYARAEAYWQEGLKLARQIGHSWLISTILGDWGELQIKRQQFDAAAATFRDMQESLPKGNQELFAQAQYGLACIAAAQGNLPEARLLGEVSFKVFESLEHRKTAEVRHWLEMLPATDRGNE